MLSLEGSLARNVQTPDLVRRFECGLTPKWYNQLLTRLLRRLVDLKSTDPATLIFLREKARRTPKPAAEPLGDWNGEYFACFGEDDRRLWSEARMFGYFSAGGGAWYSRTLKSLRKGDRIWVHIPNRGFVVTGIVEAPVVKIDAFRVQLPDGRELPLSDPSLGVQAQGMFEHKENKETAEYLVKVRWIRDLPLQEAIWEPGFFASQHSICRPRVEG